MRKMPSLSPSPTTWSTVCTRWCCRAATNTPSPSVRVCRPGGVLINLLDGEVAVEVGIECHRRYGRCHACLGPAWMVRGAEGPVDGPRLQREDAGRTAGYAVGAVAV